MSTSTVGFDLGTGNLVSAIYKEAEEQISINTLRNMFFEIKDDLVAEQELENAGLEYITQKDGDKDRIFVISEDAFKLCGIFGYTPQRPMSKGVVSTKEVDALDILKIMVQKLVGNVEEGYCVYSVPADAIDEDLPSVVYHEKVFANILKSLGYQSKSLNEGMAVIFSNCKKETFTGIGISFGAGMVNTAVSYKGIGKIKFSLGRSGDWIDKNAADSIGSAVSRITALKEKKLNLLSPENPSSNRNEKRALEALYFYYQELIDHVIKNITAEFQKDSDSLQIDENIPLVISGGTSLPNGFLELFKERIDEYKDFPYQISEIRRATDPLNAVALGCLTYAKIAPRS
jgi:hypothetical protein